MKAMRVSDGVFIGVASLGAYTGFSMLFSLNTFIAHKAVNLSLVVQACLHNPYWAMALLISPLAGFVLWYTFCDQHSLDIKLTRAGNGQYGEARWMTTVEKQKNFMWVPKGQEALPGIVIEYNKNGWWVDASDQSMLMVSPPGGGKTTNQYEPTIRYNAEVCRHHPEKASSMILTDVKGQLLSDMGGTVKNAGYTVFSLNFRFPLQSYQYNLMNNVNEHMDQSKAAASREEEILEQAKAEKFAKLLASSIVKNTGASVSSTSESSEYFNQTSEGLLTAIILLVSEFGRGTERHIVSVFRLIIDLNGLSEGSSETLQKNRLEQLFELLPESHRAKLFAGASTKADVRTSMNIFSSALGKLVSFIDAELEQMICEHSTELNTEDFIRRPTIIFLIVPDEDTTKHFFASLFIRNMMNELIAIAERQSNQVLPRLVFCEWDEFGQIPPVKDFSSLVTALRSRGVRFTVGLQASDQLDDKYSPAQAKTIRKAFQITLLSYQSPNALDTAREFSEVLGNYTTQGGSVSRGDRNDSHSIQLMGRALMTKDEWITLPKEHWILIKAGEHPLQVILPRYGKIFKEKAEVLPVTRSGHVKPVCYLTEEKVRMRAQAVFSIMPGTFDREY